MRYEQGNLFCDIGRIILLNEFALNQGLGQIVYTWVKIRRRTTTNGARTINAAAVKPAI